MTHITLYMLKQLLANFLVTLLGLSLFLVLGIMSQKGMQQGLGLDSIFKLLPYAFPLALRFSVPAALLLSTCIVFGRMSADNEIVALKSLGISPLTVIRPAILLSVCVSLGAIWMNDFGVSWGSDGMQRVFAESVEEVVYRLLKTQRSYSNSYLSVNVKDVHGRRLIQPTFVVRGGSPMTLIAREAELMSDLERGMLIIQLTDSFIEVDGHELANPAETSYEIPLSRATRRDTSTQRPAELRLSELSNEAIHQEDRIRLLEEEIAAKATFEFLLGQFSDPEQGEWRELRNANREAEERLNRIRLEPWRRIAEGFSCAFIVLVGAPLSIHMRSSNFFTSFASCFFPIVGIYYPILTWAVDRVKDGALPPMTVWVANLVLLMFAIFWTRRVLRY